REKEKQSVKSLANSKHPTSPKNNDCDNDGNNIDDINNGNNDDDVVEGDFSDDINDNFDIDDVEGDFSDDLNGNFNDFGRNVPVVSTNSEEETDYYHNKTTKVNKRQRNDEIYEDFNDKEEIAEHYNKKSRKPEAFKNITNALEICQWLVKRPKILTIAYQIYNMSDILLESPLLYETSNIMNSKIMPDKEKSNKIEGKVQELKDKRVKKGLEIATITRLKVNKFISQEVVEQILDRYLKGTNRKMLKNCRTIERLVLFVREAFKVHYTAYNVKAIKKLNNIIMDFKVLSRSGKNIALKLS
ncbi:165_t:CDS:2, partial [Funneliformis geosporum]